MSQAPKIMLDQVIDLKGDVSNSSLESTPTRTNIHRPLDLSNQLFREPQLQKPTPFGNPTPIAATGLCIALTPLSIELMGWRGASGFPATNGANFFFGGLLLILSAIGEFIVGNTFPSVVFSAFGAHFLSLATTFTPSFDMVSYYTADGSQTETPPFLASFGFYNLSMGILCIIFLICSLRTNAALVVIFSTASLGFLLVTGALWNLAEGNTVAGARLLKGTGGCFFMTTLTVWYLLFSVLMTAVDMPFAVPVVDLSSVVTGMSDKKKQDSE